MSIAAQKKHTEILFIIWGIVCQRVYDWQSKLDERVFNEQLASGSFHGRYPIDDNEILQVMKQAKAEGKILPYYLYLFSAPCQIGFGGKVARISKICF